MNLPTSSCPSSPFSPSPFCVVDSLHLECALPSLIISPFSSFLPSIFPRFSSIPISFLISSRTLTFSTIILNPRFGHKHLKSSANGDPTCPSHFNVAYNLPQFPTPSQHHFTGSNILSLFFAPFPLISTFPHGEQQLAVNLTSL